MSDHEHEDQREDQAAAEVRELYSTTDAQVWGRIFHDLHGRRVGLDEDLMVGWFANAIEVGREAGRTAAARALPDISRPFEPEVEANEAADSGRDPLEQVLGTMGGYTSACWENLSGAGVFESTRARQAVEATVAWVRANTARTDDAQLVIRVPEGIGMEQVLEMAAAVKRARDTGMPVFIDPTVEAFWVRADQEVVVRQEGTFTEREQPVQPTLQAWDGDLEGHAWDGEGDGEPCAKCGRGLEAHAPV